MSLSLKRIGVIAAFALSAQAGAAQENWKLTGIAPETSLYHQLFVEKFANHIEAINGGEVYI